MPTGMVGRDAERARLRALVADAAECSTAVLVWGEAGIGKTRLVEDLATAAADGGFRVFRGGSSPLSRDVPYAPIQAALAGLGTASNRTASNRTEWYARLDAALGEPGPAAGTLVVVEDMHWADAASLGYLAHLTRNLPPAGLVLAMTFRDEGADDLHGSWLAEQLRCPGVAGVHLGALQPDETVELVRRLAPQVPHPRARELHDRSGGNPYLATELALVHPDGEVTGTLSHVLRLRLRDVGPLATRAVAAAGAISRPTTDAELAAAVGDEVAVRTAHEEGLLEAVPGEPGRCRARHPVVAELAYASLLPEDRRALHARLAVGLEPALRADAAAADVAEVAEHHRRAAHAEDTLVWAVRAAEAAERECAFAEAGRWYSVAVESWLAAPAVTGLVPARERLVEAAGRNFGVAGRHEAVIEVLGRFLDAPDEQRPDAGAALLVHRSWARFVRGDTEGARQDLDRAGVEAARAGDASLEADVYAQQAMIEGTCSRWDVAEGAASEADRLGRESGNRRAQGRAATVLGTAALFVHGQVDRGLALLRRGLDIAWELAEPDDFSLAAVCLQSYYLDTGDVRSAGSVSTWLRHRLRLLAPEGHWMDGMLRGNQMHALLETGEWDRALAVGSETPDEIGFAEMELALVHGLRGDVEEARAGLERCADLDRRDQPQFFVAFHEVETQLALLENDPHRALRAALLASEAYQDIPDVIGESGPLLLAGLRAAVLVPDEDAFERLMDTLGAAALSSHRSEPIALQAAAERSLLRSSGDAASRWRECVAAWESLGRPYEAAFARVRVAEALLRGRGGRPGATESLAAALATALELGAVPLRDEVTALARTARLRVETAPAQERARPAAPGLTDREHQVLALVAQGRTNREIGESLFMSPKTASVHVTHVLQKLGVSTRVQAATVAATHGLLPPGDPAEAHVRAPT